MAFRQRRAHVFRVQTLRGYPDFGLILMNMQATINGLRILENRTLEIERKSNGGWVGKELKDSR